MPDAPLPESSPSRSIPFEPALEGLRGFALLGMLCYHSEFSWAVGGFLPIATFFTLSGHLITSLFLAEYERSGRIRLGAFWARRFRRLMPAALLTLAAMTLFGAFVATPDQLARLRADVLWALLYVANWHFWLADVAYTQLFEAPSPVQHFWSLAIEEQFYLVFPMIAAFGLWIGKGSRATFACLLGLLCLASVITSLWLTAAGASIDRVYYGSDTRAAELLLGGLFAVLWHGRQIERTAMRRLIEGIGALAMLAMVGLWSVVELESKWLYQGGFAAYTLLSLAVIAAGIQPEGPVRRILSGRAMRWMGRVSYGAYLFHWPLFLWLTPERTGLEGAPLFALRFAATFGLAGLSYTWLESPIRTGRVLTGWRPFVAMPASFALVLLGTSAVTAGDAGGRHTEAELEAARSWYYDAIAAPDPPPGDPPNLHETKPRVAFFGDSTAVALGAGLGYWLVQEDVARYRLGAAELGCGLARNGVYRVAGREQQRPGLCTDRDVTWSSRIEKTQPDIAVVMFGPWEVRDRKLPGHEGWLHLGDPALDDYLLGEMLAGTDMLLADGTLVVWLTHPAIEVRSKGVAPATPYSGSDPARMARYNELVFEIERLRPGRVRIIDLAAWMRALPAGELDPHYRPDGTHLSLSGALTLSEVWIGEELLRVYREQGAKVAAGP